MEELIVFHLTNNQAKQVQKDMENHPDSYTFWQCKRTYKVISLIHIGCYAECKHRPWRMSTIDITPSKRKKKSTSSITKEELNTQVE